MTYVAAYLVAGLLVASLASLAFSGIGNEALFDGLEFNGLYLYDPTTDELVPAQEISVGDVHVPMYVESGSDEQHLAIDDLPASVRISSANTWAYLVPFGSDEQSGVAVSIRASEEPDGSEAAAAGESPAGLRARSDDAEGPSDGGEPSAHPSEVVEDGPFVYSPQPVGDEAFVRSPEPADEPAGTLEYAAFAELVEDPRPDDLAAYDEQARKAVARLVEATGDTGAMRIVSDAIEGTAGDDALLISPSGYYLHEEMSPEARAMITTCGVLAIAVFPLFLGLALVLAARRFYGRRIRPALALLDDASAKIAERDLDFSVSYGRRDEMGRLADSFEVMRASLAASQRELMRTAEERRRLNAAFAHDLRTPLTVLKGKVELMAERLHAAGAGMPASAASPAGDEGGLDTAALARDIASLGAQVERLERYVAAMSSLRKLDEREVARSPLSLEALAHDLADEGTGLCRPHGVAFELALNSAEPASANVAVDAKTGRITVDRALVLEVADNLIANATRYARTRVMARLFVEQPIGAAGIVPHDGGAPAAGSEGDKTCPAGTTPRCALVLIVDDDGPGFSPEARERGCEAFFGENRGGDHLGLGLNIARILCERHDGALELGRSPDTGGARVIARFAL